MQIGIKDDLAPVFFVSQCSFLLSFIIYKLCDNVLSLNYLLKVSSYSFQFISKRELPFTKAQFCFLPLVFISQLLFCRLRSLQENFYNICSFLMEEVDKREGNWWSSYSPGSVKKIHDSGIQRQISG